MDECGMGMHAAFHPVRAGIVPRHSASSHLSAPMLCCRLFSPFDDHDRTSQPSRVLRPASPRLVDDTACVDVFHALTLLQRATHPPSSRRSKKSIDTVEIDLTSPSR
ncbi:hypothetical protein MSAN_01301500 [Mycena sanguinolenta]|uniref:Uncharacterized protein n=1 Tax=Mycena sanguinolenta TaxID=230812 RepID=A0A8H6YDN0_9AGAR|nr:hypothetical protein MSAN_01301500 [Mycena sanguinolenta]